MRLTALVESADHVCCRYRLTAFRDHLAAAGHRLELTPLPGGWWPRIQAFRSLRASDCVILQRKLLQPWQLFLLRQHARRLLFDFDDAVFLRDSYSRRGPESSARMRKFRTVVRAADVVVAGNSFLLERARAAGSSAGLVYLPTCVDSDRYRLADHTRRGQGIELVWIGSSSTLQGLVAIRPILEHLGQTIPGLHLKLICDRFIRLHHLPVLGRPWSEATEAGELASADIGMSWLPDDSWSRGKCGLKVLQYMAAGLPVVGNPVGVQADLIRDGETGFLVETGEELANAVNRLALDPQLRRRLGRAGRQRLERDFSIEAGARKWCMLLEELGQRRKSA